MNQGFIKLKREPAFLLLKQLSGDEYKVYSLLLLRASFKERKVALGNQAFTSKKGEVYIGLKGIVEGCALKEPEIKPILKSLSGQGLIETKPFVETGEFSTLKNKVLNYEEMTNTGEAKHQGKVQDPKWGDNSENDPF